MMTRMGERRSRTLALVQVVDFFVLALALTAATDFAYSILVGPWITNRNTIIESNVCVPFQESLPVLREMEGPGKIRSSPFGRPYLLLRFYSIPLAFQGPERNL